jgi:predicted Zn-dependent protease
MSPQEDALLQLTVAEGPDPRSALSAFLSQGGIQAGASSYASINGLPAAGADFHVEGEGEAVDGRATFIRHEGTVFQLVAFATTASWQRNSAALRGGQESFRVLRDAAYLRVQPARLRVVTVRRSATLQDFLEQEGASSRIQEVRLLNRLEGNPILDGGQILKIPSGASLPGGG